MIFNVEQKPPFSPTCWHLKFLWWPTRISSSQVAWLEQVKRRWIVDDEGTWAGGYKGHWEYEQLGETTYGYDT